MSDVDTLFEKLDRIDMSLVELNKTMKQIAKALDCTSSHIAQKVEDDYLRNRGDLWWLKLEANLNKTH